MKLIIIFSLVLLLLIWNRSYLLLFWIALSPIISNLIQIPKDNPFFGSYRIVDYVGYAAGPAKHLVELLDFDRIVLLLLLLAVVKQITPPTQVLAARVQQWLGILVIAVYISALFSDNVPNGLRKATDTFGLCYAAFVIGRVYLANSRDWNRFVNAILILGAILGSTCFVEYRRFGEWGLYTYEDIYRVTGPFRYWETLGMAVSLVAFVAWFKWVTAAGLRVRLKKVGYIAIGLLMAYCVFRTETRTIMIALAFGFALLLYRASGGIMSRVFVKRILLALALISLYLLIEPELLTNSRFYTETLTRNATEESRQETYVAATRMFLNNPLIGIGLKNFQDDMKYYLSAREMVYSAVGTSSCHSSYLVTAAECGLMGLAPLFILITYAFAMCRQYFARGNLLEDKAWAVAMLGMTLTFFLGGVTFDLFFDPTMQNQLYYMCLGATAARLESLNHAVLT